MAELQLTRSIYNQIRGHGERDYPNECCGVLLGQATPEGWRIEVAVPAGNARTDAPHNRYEISSRELVKIDREARLASLEIAGFYHSHPDRAAQWSSFDFTEAHWFGCSYLITAVMAGRATETNAFLLTGDEDEKGFEDQNIVVAD